jgi:hypothetical protein
MTGLLDEHPEVAERILARRDDLELCIGGENCGFAFFIAEGHIGDGEVIVKSVPRLDRCQELDLLIAFLNDVCAFGEEGEQSTEAGRLRAMLPAIEAGFRNGQDEVVTTSLVMRAA